MFERLLPQADPDAPLVGAAREGDVRAFDALVYRYQGSVRRYVAARLDGSADADRVAEEILVAAWRELRRAPATVRFRTWLFGIALLHTQEAARRQMRLQRLLGVGERTDGASPPVDAFYWSLASAEPEEVAEAIRRLPPLSRHLLELYYYAGLTLPEVARLLSLEDRDVREVFVQAHRMLRTEVDVAAADELEAAAR